MDWHEIAKWLWGLLVPAGWWIFNRQDKRMDLLEASMEKKADKAELDRQRDNVGTLFDKLDEHARRDEKMHTVMLEKLHDMHVDLLEKIGK